MNYCDHGHATEGQTRLLPYGGSGSGNIICCHKHYLEEMAYRKTMQRDHGGEWDFPEWEDLKIYAEAVKKREGTVAKKPKSDGWTHIQGKVSFSRGQLGSGEQRFCLRIEDEVAGVLVLEAEFDPETVALLLSGCGHLDALSCRVNTSGTVGTKAERKTVVIKLDRDDAYVSGHDKKSKAQIVELAFAEYEVEGWRGRASDLFNPHNNVPVAESGKVGRSVIFERHVDAATGEPVDVDRS